MNLWKQRGLEGPILLVVAIGDFSTSIAVLIPLRQLIDLGVNIKGSEDEKSLEKKLEALEQQFDQVQLFQTVAY